MATQIKPVDVEQFFNTEAWTDAARKAGNDFLDLYEQTVDQLADLELKTAAATKLPAVVQIAETHAAVSRDIAGAYTTAVRDLLKA